MKHLHINIKALLLCLTLIIPPALRAASVRVDVDPLRYTVDTEAMTAEVYGLINSSATINDLVIPDFIEYEGSQIPVTSIRDEAFVGKSNLTGSLTIGNRVESVGDYAFHNCKGMTGSLRLGESLKTIGAGAFEYTNFSGSLNIPNSVYDIKEYCFAHTNLSDKLIIGENLKHITRGAFTDCKFTTLEFNAIDCTTYHTTGNDNPFRNIEIVKIGNSVVNISPYFFANCSKLKTIEFGNSIKKIGNEAFAYCSNLTGSLTIGNSVQSIGDRAFYECSGLTGSLTIGNSVQTIGKAAFNRCEFIGTLTIGNSVQTIGVYAFESCKFTGSLTIPNSVLTIGNYAFCGCSDFTGSLTIGNSVQTIGENAFDYCSGFTGSLTIPNSVQTIGKYAFDECRGFTGSLTIPNSVLTIGNYAFCGCSGFTGSLTIPNSVQTIGNYAFYGCSGFTGLFTIGNSVQTIGTSAFSYCRNLTGNLIIPESVTEIGGLCFAGCDKFSSLIISSSKTVIKGSFACRNLQSITSLGLTPPKCVNGVGDDHVFDYSNYEKPLYVPKESVNLYKTATEWKKFKYINPLQIVATGIALDKTELELTVGQTETLTATVTPEDASEDVVWAVDDAGKNIISVDQNGKIIALGVGTATVTATAGNVSATCKVTVKPVTASTVTIRVPDKEVFVGDKVSLTATVTPDNTTDKTIVWTCSTPEIATIDAQSGELTALAPGEAKVTATCGVISGSATIKVKPVLATSVNLNAENLTLLIGQTGKLTATVAPENTTDKTIVWKSDNESIATVGMDGTVTAVSVGVANVTATCGAVYATCKVTVKSVGAATVTISVPDKEVFVGDKVALTATVTPDNTTDKTIVWTCSTPKIATIDAQTGELTALAPGEAKVTATCGEISGSATITVKPVLATSVTLSAEDMTLFIGQTGKLTATVAPENVTDKTIVWKSENEAVATVSADGTVTAVSVGVANVTATCGAVSATCKVTVKPVTAATVTISVPDKEVFVGARISLTATVTPDNTTDKTIVWACSTPEIATIDAQTGELTALAPGEAKVTATCGEIVGNATITVKPVLATSVTLNAEDMTLFIGQTGKLTATVAPENTTDKTIVWKSDNEAIAAVSADGTVTAVSVGVANITASCGAVSATCKVTVNPVTASDITLGVQDMTLLVGQSDKIIAKVFPEDTTDKTVIWTTDNEAIATVSADGTVTAIAVGVANITATCGEVSATCKVTVIKQALTPTQLLRKGDGTSNTFVAMMSKDDATLEAMNYRYVFGYDTLSDESHVLADTPWRYARADHEIYWDSSNDFWVFAYYIDTDGNVCVSSRRHLDGTVDNDFNAQDFIGANAKVSDNIKGIYTIEGQYVGKDIKKLSSGIYVVITSTSSYKIVK